MTLFVAYSWGRDPGPHLIHEFLWPCVYSLNDILIGSVVLQGSLMQLCSQHTHTDRPSYICSNRPHLASAVMQPKPTAAKVLQFAELYTVWNTSAPCINQSNENGQISTQCSSKTHEQISMKTRIYNYMYVASMNTQTRTRTHTNPCGALVLWQCGWSWQTRDMSHVLVSVIMTIRWHIFSNRITGCHLSVNLLSTVRYFQTIAIRTIT